MPRWLAGVIGLLIAASADAQQPPVPQHVELSEAVRNAIAAPWLRDDERAAMRVFHGVWQESDLATPEAQAHAALIDWKLSDPIFLDPQVSAELRAEAQLRSGELREAISTLDGAESIRAWRIRAACYEMLGELQAANTAIDMPVRQLTRNQLADADELTEGVRAMMIRARLQGQPSRDFHTMIGLLSRAHQELDRLYWPARLAEGELLEDKHDSAAAVQALHETLALNPRVGEAWYMLGRIMMERFDFASAGRASQHLRRLNPAHPLAELLDAETRLVLDDPDGALAIIEALLERFPMMRHAHALHAAAKAIQYDDEAMGASLARFDALSPGGALAYYVVGRQLSMSRQYEAAADMLEEAIRRQPAWPAPQIELGLMELQSGRDANALYALRNVVKLDPFNVRATNSLHLLEEITQYATVETPHFIVRYKPGIDQVMADMMPEVLEEIHQRVAGRFNFTPDRKTVIELMPNHRWFAVRIVGMPSVHTVAACTGPVIALETPREGPPGTHTGLFDWPRVLQHEYTHTITLAQTRNRIPHWLTEAAAVSMELSPRPYATCRLLAQSLELGRLFSLEEIKWAFVRPRRPEDRSLAYAQGHWMLEYMNMRFGDDAVLQLLERYFEGEREEQAVPSVLGISREQFFRDFLQWAAGEVESWGLAASPTVRELMDEVQDQQDRTSPEWLEAERVRLNTVAKRLADQIGEPAREGRTPLDPSEWPAVVLPPVQVTDEMIDEWLRRHPGHPDLLELKLRRTIQQAGGVDESMIDLLKAYAAARPVDPMPHERLAQLFLAGESPERAIPHLEYLDARTEKTPVYAVQLAHLYRRQGDTARALERAMRALHFNPYHAPNRELAAAIAIEARRYDLATMHIRALTLLEPGRPQHQRRLEAIERLSAGGS